MKDNAEAYVALKLYNDLYMFSMAVIGQGDSSCLSPTEMPRKTVVCGENETDRFAGTGSTELTATRVSRLLFSPVEPHNGLGPRALMALERAGLSGAANSLT